MISDAGKDGTPKYSVGGRVKELATDKTPAPGAYSPEKTAPLGEKKAPSYTMGMLMIVNVSSCCACFTVDALSSAV